MWFKKKENRCYFVSFKVMDNYGAVYCEGSRMVELNNHVTMAKFHNDLPGLIADSCDGEPSNIVITSIAKM